MTRLQRHGCDLETKLTSLNVSEKLTETFWFHKWVRNLQTLIMDIYFISGLLLLC